MLEFTTTGTFVGWLGLCTAGTNCDTVNHHSKGFSCTAATCTGLTFGHGDGQLSGPRYVAIDSSGNLYVADEGSQRVEKFTNNGTFVGWLGGCSSGSNCNVSVSGDFHSIGFSCTFATCGLPVGGNSNGEFNGPYGIAVDSSGNIYVLAVGNDLLQKFDKTGNFLAKSTGPGGGDGIFDGPVAIAVDSSGNFYVTEGVNDRVDKFASSVTFVGWAGKCTAGINCDTVSQHSLGFKCTAATCTGGSICGTGNGQFCNPDGIAVGPSNNVFVVDFANFRMQELSNSGTFITAWGSSGCGSGQFSNPLGDTVDSSGNVYVTDTTIKSCVPGDRVEVFSLPTTSTSIVCTPSSLVHATSTTCKATVKDTGISTGTPTGKVKFTSNLPGTFSSTKCTLSGSGTSASCSVTFTPTSAGSYKITATYLSDPTHAASKGKFTLTVT